MKPFKRGKLTFVLLLLVVFHPGCGTIYTLVDGHEGVQHGLVMSGIRFDCRGASEQGRMIFATGKVLCVLDMPSSLVSDLLLFPATAAVEYRRARRRDERLYGTWISDRDRNLAQYHQTYAGRHMSDDFARRTMSEYGQRRITFSKDKMVEACDGRTNGWPYRVVSSATNRIVIQCYQQLSHIELEDPQARGFWINRAIREYYRKQE